MAKVVKIVTDEPRKRARRAPDVSDEQREKRLFSLALDRVEERMANGTATAAEYLHFIKLATERAKLEQEELRCKTELLRAKTDAIAEAKRTAQNYSKVIEAMTGYGSTVLASTEEDISDIL